jgi:hypothetical protein
VFVVKDTHSVTGRKLAHLLLFKRMAYVFSETEDDQLWSGSNKLSQLLNDGCSTFHAVV